MLVTFVFQIIFLETICNDERIIERNIRLKIQQSPDYAEEYASLRNHLIVMPMVLCTLIALLLQARF